MSILFLIKFFSFEKLRKDRTFNYKMYFIFVCEILNFSITKVIFDGNLTLLTSHREGHIIIKQKFVHYHTAVSFKLLFNENFLYVIFNFFMLFFIPLFYDILTFESYSLHLHY